MAASLRPAGSMPASRTRCSSSFVFPWRSQSRRSVFSNSFFGRDSIKPLNALCRAAMKRVAVKMGVSITSPTSSTMRLARSDHDPTVRTTLSSSSICTWARSVRRLTFCTMVCESRTSTSTFNFISSICRLTRAMCQQIMMKVGMKQITNTTMATEAIISDICKPVDMVILQLVFQFRWIIPFLARVEPGQQGTNTNDALSLEQQCLARAGHFVGARAIKNDVSVARNFALSRLHLVQSHMQRAIDHCSGSFDFRARSNVQNEQALSGLQFLIKFVDRDSRHPQLPQQPVSSKKFVADESSEQTRDQCQCSVAEIAESGDNLFQLRAEYRTHYDEAADIELSRQCVEA